MHATHHPTKLTMPIFLLGFMGSGKSYWAKYAGKKYRLPWVDLDQAIEERLGHTLPHYFQSYGEASFREVEARVLRELVDDRVVQLIACGGGTPCFYDNMDFMNATGFTVYLKTPVDVLAKRLLPEINTRPLLQGMDATSLPAFIERKLQEREPVYQQARLIWRTEQSTAGDFDRFLQSLLQPISS